MPRTSNFYYQQDPWAAIGKSLGTALFGDPVAAQEQREAQAKMDLMAAQSEQARAHAGLYGEQSTGQQWQNKGASKWYDLFFNRPTPVANVPGPAVPVDPLAPLPEAPVAQAPAGGFDLSPSSIAQAIGAMALMRGENVDVGETVGALGTMLGDEGYMRRGMMAMGHTPGENFAPTAQRADEIRQQGFDADYNKSTAVARINHASDIPVAQIAANARVEDARIGADADRDVQVIKNDGNFVSLGDSLVTSLFPNAHSTGRERTPQRNREVGGVPNSKHLAGDGIEALDVRPIPGVTFAQFQQQMRAKYGDRLVEVIDETVETNGTGPHWHVAVRQDRSKGGSGKKAGAVKAVPQGTAEQIKTDVENAVAGWDDVPPRLLQATIAFAMSEYQKKGNQAAAVSTAIRELKRQRDMDRPGGKPAPQGGKPVRIASDDEWARLPKGALFIGPDGQTRRK